MMRRSKRIQNTIDRLSGLPDYILHHILSFLDTKSSVKTSVLSKRWISVWKYVPVLNFSRSRFASHSGFERFAEQVLSLRSDRSSVTRITVHIWVNRRKDPLDRILRYAASHGVRELYISTRLVTQGVFGSICSCYQSMKVLELEGTTIAKTDVGLFSRLQLLETLTLSQCYFGFGDDDDFTNFPRLETLKLLNCSTLGDYIMVVTAPKLLNLEIVLPEYGIFRINAPKLESFSLEISSSYFTIEELKCLQTYAPELRSLNLETCCTLAVLSKSNLPSLRRANITVFGCDDAKKQLLLENLFKILHNVQALNLKLETFESLIHTWNSMKHQSSPFKKLKSLNMRCWGKLVEVPDEMIRYFFGGSPIKAEKRFAVEK